MCLGLGIISQNMQDVDSLYNSDMMQTKQESLAVQYLKCSKGQLHTDENLNIVCLETSCRENLVCCVGCVENEHKKHTTQPLKFVLNQVKAVPQTPSAKINIDILLDIVNHNKEQTFELLHKYKAELLNNLDSIELALQGFYNNTIDQLLLRNTDTNLVISESIQRVLAPKSTEDLRNTLKKIVAFLQGSKEKKIDFTEEEIKLKLNKVNQEISKSISQSMKEINLNLETFQKTISTEINNFSLWKGTKYRFSPLLKHHDIQLLDDNTAKVLNNSGYKFAIIEPYEAHGNCNTFEYTITQLTSNWIALGFCYKNVVKQKGFTFNFGSIGHGAYMVSSNGASWSHSVVQLNNTIKAIKFKKNDIISATLNSALKKVIFLNKNTNEKYELPYDMIIGDELYPCVLFYYVNDCVKFQQA